MFFLFFVLVFPLLLLLLHNYIYEFFFVLVCFIRFYINIKHACLSYMMIMCDGSFVMFHCGLDGNIFRPRRLLKMLLRCFLRKCYLKI